MITLCWAASCDQRLIMVGQLSSMGLLSAAITGFDTYSVQLSNVVPSAM